MKKENAKQPESINCFCCGRIRTMLIPTMVQTFKNPPDSSGLITKWNNLAYEQRYMCIECMRPLFMPVNK